MRVRVARVTSVAGIRWKPEWRRRERKRDEEIESSERASICVNTCFIAIALHSSNGLILGPDDVHGRHAREPSSCCAVAPSRGHPRILDPHRTGNTEYVFSWTVSSSICKYLRDCSGIDVNALAKVTRAKINNGPVKGRKGRKDRRGMRDRKARIDLELESNAVTVRSTLPIYHRCNIIVPNWIYRDKCDPFVSWVMRQVFYVKAIVVTT